MPIELNALLTCLQLEEIEAGAVWRGGNLDLNYHRVFGGQILAQAITVLGLASPSKAVKSFTMLFPREGDSSKPLDYQVIRHQDGRTFGASSVVVSQEGKVVATAQASMHVPDTDLGPSAQLQAPALGGPEDAVAGDRGVVPGEVRVVGDVDLSKTESGPAEFAVWWRDGAQATDEGTSQALVSHATDLTIIGTALRPIEGLSQTDSGKRFHSAVTSHSLWFHRPFTSSDWLLISQTSPVLTGSRAYGRGDVHRVDGQLVASFAQEAMVRPLT